MIRIGCVQTNPILGQIETNLKNFENLVSNAEADLLVFPELALTGYFFTSSSDARPHAHSISGTLVTEITRIARDHKVAIVTGFLEDDSGVLYNSAIAFDCRGNLVGHYRKVHLFYLEKLVFASGNLGFPVFDILVRSGMKTRLGLQICYDWRFPESTRSLALKGAEIVAMPSNIISKNGMLHETLKVRAFENKVIVAFADRVGSESALVENEKEVLEFRGDSCIINYNGEILALDSTNSESITYADVLTENTRSKQLNNFNDIITDRRNNVYFT